MVALAQWVEAGAVAHALRGSGTLYMLVNAGHILGIGLLLGAILPLDARIVGIVRGPDLSVIGPFLSRAAGFGLTLAIVTGMVLWSVDATDYLGNPAFLWKMGALGCGALVVLIQHASGGWRKAVTSGKAGTGTKVLAVCSLCIWIATLLAGRWIGFV